MPTATKKTAPAKKAAKKATTTAKKTAKKTTAKKSTTSTATAAKKTSSPRKASAKKTATPTSRVSKAAAASTPDRKHQVTVEFTTAEYEGIRATAKSMGWDAPTYLRYKATGVAPVN